MDQTPDDAGSETPGRAVEPSPRIPVPTLRRTVLLVAALNLAYFLIEGGVALAIRSVSLLADSVDFLEDTAINILIALALGWSLAARAAIGRALAIVILIPAVAVVVQLVLKVGEPAAPAVIPLILTAAGAAVVNLVAALLLARIRASSGAMGRAAWLAARNDVVINLAIILMALVTLAVGTGWPDIVLGGLIIVLNSRAALEVWRLAGEESLAARALAGEDPDDD
ncbi:MAG: cation transporter [Microcella sp.]|uniref:cation transporter n=1 Tax=Microcella sp. TaxID=1913979 RepID=UPI002717BE0F|nr:cation transporter [Microcella sp.]MDO8336779.1 cation transporter [Microcella sp.]